MKNELPHVIVIAGLIVFAISSLLLILSGSGDQPESYRAWIIAGAIILSSGVIALEKRKNNS